MNQATVSQANAPPILRRPVPFARVAQANAPPMLREIRPGELKHHTTCEFLLTNVRCTGKKDVRITFGARYGDLFPIDDDFAYFPRANDEDRDADDNNDNPEIVKELAAYKGFLLKPKKIYDFKITISEMKMKVFFRMHHKGKKGKFTLFDKPVPLPPAPRGYVLFGYRYNEHIRVQSWAMTSLFDLVMQNFSLFLQHFHEAGVKAGVNHFLNELQNFNPETVEGEREAIRSALDSIIAKVKEIFELWRSHGTNTDATSITSSAISATGGVAIAIGYSIPVVNIAVFGASVIFATTALVCSECGSHELKKGKRELENMFKNKIGTSIIFDSYIDLQNMSTRYQENTVSHLDDIFSFQQLLTATIALYSNYLRSHGIRDHTGEHLDNFIRYIQTFVQNYVDSPEAERHNFQENVYRLLFETEIVNEQHLDREITNILSRMQFWAHMDAAVFSTQFAVSFLKFAYWIYHTRKFLLGTTAQERDMALSASYFYRAFRCIFPSTVPNTPTPTIEIGNTVQKCATVYNQETGETEMFYPPFERTREGLITGGRTGAEAEQVAESANVVNWGSRNNVTATMRGFAVAGVTLNALSIVFSAFDLVHRHKQHKDIRKKLNEFDSEEVSGMIIKEFLVLRGLFVYGPQEEEHGGEDENGGRDGD